MKKIIDSVLSKLKKLLISCIIALHILSCVICVSAYSGNGDITVYVTTYGSRYHDGDCGSLWNSKIAIALEDAFVKGYTRCSRCSPPVYTGTAKPQASKDNYDSNRTSPTSTTRGNPTTENSNISQTKTPEKDHDGIIACIIISIIASFFVSIALNSFFFNEGCLSFFLLYFPVTFSFITALGSIFHNWNVLFLFLSLGLLSVVICILFIMRRIQNTKNKKLEEEKKRLEAQKLAEIRRAKEEKKKLEAQKLAEIRRAKEEEFYASLLLLKQKSDIIPRFLSCNDIILRAEQEFNRLMDEHGAVMNYSNKICIINNGANYGDLATVYYSPRAKAYHRRSCVYRGTTYAHVLTPPPGKHPCVRCRPDLIDTSWMKKCLRIQSSIASYKLFANSDPVFSQPHIAHSCVQRLDVLSSLIRPKDQQEMRIALQAKNGMVVWMPASKMDQWQKAQADQSPEAKKRRQQMANKIMERLEKMQKESQQR